MIEDEFRREYHAAIANGGLIHRTDRGLIELSGKDRVAWLNNLVTNVIKTLSPGEGNYAFCINVKGRIVFDLNMLVRPEVIWLDVDRRWIEPALKWFDRYHITEDIQLTDITSQQERIAVVGPAAAKTCASLGFGNLVPMAWLQHETRERDGARVTMVRHDFVGLVGAEIVIVGDMRQTAVDAILSAAKSTGADAMTDAVVDVLRVEAGLPASVVDIDEEVIPPETGQIERGISYQKGCYLGQEVLERMRSRGGLARKLVGIRLEGGALPKRNAAVCAGDAEIGRVTSSVYSLAIDAALSLGYVRSGVSAPGTSVEIRDADRAIPGVIVALPVRT